MVQRFNLRKLKSHEEKVNKKIAWDLKSLTNCDELFPCDIKRTIFQVHDMFSLLHDFNSKSRMNRRLKPVASDDFFLTFIRSLRWIFWFLFNLLLLQYRRLNNKKCIFLCDSPIHWDSEADKRLKIRKNQLQRTMRRIHENSEVDFTNKVAC